MAEGSLRSSRPTGDRERGEIIVMRSTSALAFSEVETPPH